MAGWRALTWQQSWVRVPRWFVAVATTS